MIYKIVADKNWNNTKVRINEKILNSYKDTYVMEKQTFLKNNYFLGVSNPVYILTSPEDDFTVNYENITICHSEKELLFHLMKLDEIGEEKIVRVFGSLKLKDMIINKASHIQAFLVMDNAKAINGYNFNPDAENQWDIEHVSDLKFGRTALMSKYYSRH